MAKKKRKRMGFGSSARIAGKSPFRVIHYQAGKESKRTYYGSLAVAIQAATNYRGKATVSRNSNGKWRKLKTY